MLIRYRRDLAVAYADQWWNGANPNFRSFYDNDCTNFTSQCLWAGGAPMKATGKRDSGWWYFGNGGDGDTWSISWAGPHSLYWYLKTTTSHSKGYEVDDIHLLEPGDLIFYDFDANNVWNHSVIVTEKTKSGEPLINAHTDSAWHRDWTYRDSIAYTPQIRYAFIKIDDNFNT